MQGKNTVLTATKSILYMSRIKNSLKYARGGREYIIQYKLNT